MALVRTMKCNKVKLCPQIINSISLLIKQGIPFTKIVTEDTSLKVYYFVALIPGPNNKDRNLKDAGVPCLHNTDNKQQHNETCLW